MGRALPPRYVPVTVERESPALVRVARSAEDWADVRSLCCRTGNGGDPIDRKRWPLFAELWIGPYQRLVPDWTYVAEVDGRVVGYLTGCPDTAALRRARRFPSDAPAAGRHRVSALRVDGGCPARWSRSRFGSAVAPKRGSRPSYPPTSRGPIPRIST